jgi:hypothetical protein
VFAASFPAGFPARSGEVRLPAASNSMKGCQKLFPDSLKTGFHICRGCFSLPEKHFSGGLDGHAPRNDKVTQSPEKSNLGRCPDTMARLVPVGTDQRQLLFPVAQNVRLDIEQFYQFTTTVSWHQRNSIKNGI